MILHIKFTDKSNPYVFYGDKSQVIFEWARWQLVPTARPTFMTTHYQCMRVSGGGWAVGRYFDGAHKTYTFERLGSALNKLERLEQTHK